jgi:hypothetical protein
MVALRERLSDALLRFGTEAAVDRMTMQRSMEAARGARGHEQAAAALEVARWVDTVALWVAWRLRPRHITL